MRIPDAYQVAIDRWGGPASDHAGVPEPVVLYAVVQVMHNEVANGSFGQYFFNDYGAEAKLAIKGLDAIGAKQSAAIAREVVALFGPGGAPADRARRQKLLETIDGGSIERLSDAWLKDPDRLQPLLARYAVAHKEHFATQTAPATAPVAR